MNYRCLHGLTRSRRYYLILSFVMIFGLIYMGYVFYTLYDYTYTQETKLYSNPFVAEYDYPHQCNNFTHIYKQETPRTYILRGPKQGRKVVIFHWQQQTYDNKPNWKEIEKELCPYPSDLIDFWNSYRNIIHSLHDNVPFFFGKRWPLGYAPCFFFRLDNQPSVQCAQNGIVFEITSNYTRFREADIIYMDYPFYLNTKGRPPFFQSSLLPPKLPHQVWWYSFGRESLAYYPFAFQTNLLDRFDISIGAPEPMHDIFYPLLPISDLAPYYTTVDFSAIKQKKISIGSSANPIIAMMISNCEPQNQRNRIMQELNSLVEVHSYGKCLNNKKIPKPIMEKYNIPDNYDTYFGDWPAIKRDVFSPYWFAFTPENSNCVDYVTEKVYDALAADLIPIYLGAPNIREYVPENSIIVASDFENTNELVEHLKELMQDERKLAKYFDWKKRPQAQFCKKCNMNISERKECQLLDRATWVE
ncbi:uncharacterized protein VTP21DRAFT_1510 [Calcarisporiella thermophila]|uniref:uncharacterized protein n=1 Tax=Calcarisporiella thermophila TaxID=911321 RepID=UPI0037432D36